MDKCFEEVLRSAFWAGIATGVRYEDANAIPISWVDLKFEAFRAEWRGEPWSQEEWARRMREHVRETTPESHRPPAPTPGGSVAPDERSYAQREANRG